MKRASYRAGVEWIAYNDEPTLTDENAVFEQVSVMLLGDLFDVAYAKVARDVVAVRAKVGESEATA